MEGVKIVAYFAVCLLVALAIGWMLALDLWSMVVGLGVGVGVTVVAVAILENTIWFD